MTLLGIKNVLIIATCQQGFMASAKLNELIHAYIKMCFLLKI